MVVLDSGGVSYFAQRKRPVAALIAVLRERDLWPPVVPAVVLVECLHGHSGRDANTNAFLKTCDIVEELSERVARRAARLRRLARTGSAADAIVVAFAEPHGVVITSDADDLRALAAHAEDVLVEVV
ncbi:MAG: hypothetical protein IT385_26330 [Deltaproteobacteria bacterium]|nr:hypothetical protein [Deltaproteobacteria bacterium]